MLRMISMEDGEKLSLDQIRPLPDASGELHFPAGGRLYEWASCQPRSLRHARKSA
jgi:hypothetical protein